MKIKISFFRVISLYKKYFFMFDDYRQEFLLQIDSAVNYKEKDEECDLDIVPNEPRKEKLNIVMSNSLGFGGHNASIIISNYKE